MSSADARARIDAVALCDRVAGGDRRALAKALTRAENEDPALRRELDRRRVAIVGKARRVGFTGPPGAGKSSLVDALVKVARRRGETVAVLAVDPSSPIGGGAFLGDRVRLGAHALDDGVFVRSQAARGALGGLSATTPDLVDVLSLAPFDRIFVETVGVGQSEVAIVALADLAVVVLAPGAGDVVQAMKSGLIELGDLFVVNKGDLPDADVARRDLEAGLEFAPNGAEKIARIKTASAMTGAGVEELLSAIDSAASAEATARRGRAVARRLDAAVCRELGRLRLLVQVAEVFDRQCAALESGAVSFDEAKWNVVVAAVRLGRKERES
jgi:LAO/AO transport system kinase